MCMHMVQSLEFHSSNSGCFTLFLRVMFQGFWPFLAPELRKVP